MTGIRVMIVDDAVVVRRGLSDILSSEPGLEVVGTAANGRIALAKLNVLNPDVMILDLEMPELDGLQTLAELRRTAPGLPVIMFSYFTQRGATATLEALALGARDYVAKPTSQGGSNSLVLIRSELVHKIRTFAGRKIELKSALTQSYPGSALTQSYPGTQPALESTGILRSRSIDIVAIGVSTGGPAALATLMPGFPRDFPVPIVLVQHMPPVFTRMLAERLTSISQIQVTEGTAGTILEGGHAYIAPGDLHMTVERKDGQVQLAVNHDMPENSCRPAVNVLFRSVVQAYGGRVLGIILTGMGRDGLHGCAEIKEAGGAVFAQDQATSVVWGMPGLVAQAGLADKILPIESAAAEIVKKVTGSR